LALFLAILPLSSCSFSIDKYVGTYQLYSWREYDVNTYLGESKEKNEVYHYLDTTLTIDSKCYVTYPAHGNYPEQKYKVTATNRYIRFKDGPIPYEYKFEFIENLKLADGEVIQALRYGKTKRTEGFILNRTEHHINCLLKRIN